MSEHPYKTLPRHCFWRPAVAQVEPGALDPVIKARFKIDPADRIATAGSCFAQHIARHLRQKGYRYFLAEPPHPLLGNDLATAFNYGTYSARYGNLYTARQLLQTFRRSFGRFAPIEDIWSGERGEVIDPFRPQIQPGGFASESEMRADRERHLAATRLMFEETEVFVFTLGLTEGWISKVDGAVFPLCPGVAGGVFDQQRHEFKNFSVAEVVVDMTTFIEELLAVNPKVRVLLTVSPVPLAATREEDRHVLVATTYSKSVLRVACEELVKRFPNVDYFPSYEIITGAHARGSYFAKNLREVVEDGVEHVMSVFFRHYTEVSAPNVEPAAAEAAAKAENDDFVKRSEKIVATICEEELLQIR